MIGETALHDSDVVPRLRALGAAVPEAWLRALLDPPHPPPWLLAAGAVSPISGRPTSPQRWALVVFHGLVASCGGRAESARGRALAFDLAACVTAMPIRGVVRRRPLPDAVQKSALVRQLIAGVRPAERAAACLLALEASQALVRTPAMVAQARWRLGPGAEATDAQAIGTTVAEVVWHCHEDAAALLGAVAVEEAARAARMRDGDRDRRG